MGTLSAPLYAQRFAHIDQMFFTKASGGANPLPQVLTVTSTGAAFGFNATATTSSGGDWLAVSPTGDCCITPAPVSVIVSPSPALSAGSYFGQVVFTGGGTSLVVNVTLVVAPLGGAVFDNTPGQLRFSMKPGGQAASQVIQIGNAGAGTLNWRLIGSTFNGASFLGVSAQTGTAPTQINLGVLSENLPNGGATPGVYTGQLLFLAEGSIVTVPVSVSVGDNEMGQSNPLSFAKTAPGARSAALAAGSNLWPANTANVTCSGFVNQDTGVGGYTIAPDGTNTAQLVFEANPASGPVPHFEYLFADLGVGPTRTLSFHFKAAINSWVYIVSNVGGASQKVWFNLLGNGTVGTNTFPGGTATITPVANATGWYRCSITFPVNGQSATFNGFGLATSDQQTSYTGTVGNGVYEWGQQFDDGPLTPYQANVGPCLVITDDEDGSSVAAGSPIGFTIGVGNVAAPGTGTATAATLTAPLPAGPGINWSVGSPAYAGQGTCGVTGAVGSQTLTCSFGDLLGGGGATPLVLVHVTSGTTASSCGTYTNAATASTSNGRSISTLANPTTVQCQGLSIAKTHIGNFTQGQTGATYNITVSNSAPGPTSGAVTVTEAVPAGMTLVSMAGTGWICSGSTCTRSDALAGGASYPAITATVNVASNASSPQVNAVSVSGGGSAPANAIDPTTITQAAVPVVTADSVSPSSGATTNATLTAVYSDTAGFANLGHVYLLINTAVDGSRACYMMYQRSSNTLTLLNDAGTAGLGPIVAGSATTLQNSQCVLNGSGSSAVGSGNSLALTVSLSFKAAFAGSRTVFLNADAAGLSAGWQSRGTWTVPNTAAVTADSVTPSSGNTASATLTAVYSDTAGFANLGHEYLLINTAVNGSNACFVVYQGSNNTLILLNDAGTAPAGTIVAGTATTLQNSQCILNGIGSSGVGSGNSLTLTLSLSFKAAFGGSRTVFLNADGGGLGAGWQSRGTWTVPNGAAVTADSVTPSSGNTSSAALTAVYSDTAGFANLGHEYLLVNTAVNGSNACYVVYQGSNNTLMLLNDAGNSWLGPIVAGTGTTLQNSQCILNGIGSSGVGSGNSLTLTLSLNFTPAFAGNRTVFLNADAGGLSAGWQSRGTWTVPNNAAVTADSVSPSSGNTASATLTAVYSDTSGFANLGHEYLLINTAVNGANACFVVYQGSNNTLMLLNDAGNAWLGPIVAGTGTTLQNSQCILNGIGSSGVGSGNSLTLTLSLSFKAAFGGSRTVFLNADAGGLSAGWQSRGTWTVPNGAAVTADSVTPSTGNTSSATLTAVYSDTAGFANLGHEYLLINTAVNGANACFVVYQGSNNTLMLLNDAGTAWLGPIVAGTGTTLQNSQCVLNGIGSSGVGSGNSLTLTLSLNFTPAFAGSRTVFLNADGGGLGAGWQSRGTWTVP